MALTDNFILSIEKLRQRLLKQRPSEMAIQDNEHIMRDWFSALQKEFVALKPKQSLPLDTLHNQVSLAGINSAREFVWWYNGHRDCNNMAPNLKDLDTTIVLGQECSVDPRGVAALMTPQALPHYMQSNSIQYIVSGGRAPNLNFFFFAQRADESLGFFLVERLFNTSSAKAQIKVKADDGNGTEAFSSLFQSALSDFGQSSGF